MTTSLLDISNVSVAFGKVPVLRNVSFSIAPGEIVSRYGADGQGPSMYLSDPEGNTVELKGPPDE